MLKEGRAWRMLAPGGNDVNLDLAIHPITEIAFGASTELDGARLVVDRDELSGHILEDARLESVDIETVRAGESCRVGFVYDIIEPRAKEPGDGTDFPGILGPIAAAGNGTTHVLRGSTVSVIDEGQKGGYTPQDPTGYNPRYDPLGYTPGATKGAGTKVLEMGGEAARHSPYSSLHHLVIAPHARPDVDRFAVLNAVRLASIKAAVYAARAAIGHSPAETEALDLGNVESPGRAGLPRVAYIGQVHGHQHGAARDEHIVYGSNTERLAPVVLHPNEWLDGAVVTSYAWGAMDMETYFYQNHPIIGDMYRRHQAGEINFVGTIATTSADAREERERNCMLAAKLAKWTLRADGAVVTKYAGGAPHTDMFETARLCESLGVDTVVLASPVVGPDGDANSAMVMKAPEVDAVVFLGGVGETPWHVPVMERVIAGNPEAGELLAGVRAIGPGNICGVMNNQGNSRYASVVY